MRRIWATAIMLAGATMVAVAEGGLLGPAVVLIVGGALMALLAPPARTFRPLAVRVPEPIGLPVDALDIARDPLLILSGGRIVQANQAALRLWGSGIEGEDVRMVLRAPAVLKALRRPDGEQEVAGLGGADRSHLLRVHTMSDGHQAILLQDTSAQRAVERARTDFVANASHELRTPLAVILGYVETLQTPKAGGDPATREKFLATIAREGQRMLRLVEDLLSLSRIESDRHRAPEEACDVASVAAVATEEVRGTAGARAADIVGPDGVGTLTVRADRPQLTQAIRNLVANACAYGQPGTPVVVAVRQDGQEAVVTVSDQGEGVAPEHLPRLTERFYRADPARSRAVGGTGLGLAIVKHIVDRHRGRLQIDSTLGKGTRVTIRLPLATAPDAVTQPSSK